ncbi:hypothetical protein GCM10007874_17590 [Labrys miyagiensis]|uniref:Uncharacterized protein n=1 Tax=Labrys miyagiensis TaxID=346912 RepID=A0ABQ6CGI7_9HYPH|nr:hypothetical protein [Labrys miyagiensis]GLS18742.1 hypothetical protein GCM10007874_17590 [Labrys miyagiensis]
MEPGLIDVMRYGIIALAVVVVGVTVVASIAFWRADRDQAKIFALLIKEANTLQLITVLNVIVAVTLLSMLGKIDASGVISILSGIAGYVLGGIGKTSSQRANIDGG